MPALEHPNDAMLAAVLNEALPPEEVERILEHVDDCPSCERRQDVVEPAIAEYRRFRHKIDPQLPKPPRPWADIWKEMDRMDRPSLRLRQVGSPRRIESVPARRRIPFPAWMSAVAAGILIAGLMLWPRGDSLLRAETLLRKAGVAAATHSSARARTHVRVKTRTASFIRPAVLVNGAAADGMDLVRTKFEAVHYDWNDPLNPATFGGWRNGLANRTDKVAVTEREVSGEPKAYTIDTTTSEGGLREASLTVEAKELLPVGGRFQFADSEWVEIAAVPEVPETPVAPAPTSVVSTVPAPSVPEMAPPAPPAPSAAELAEREIQVRAAIERNAAGAGQPIGIETESGNVIVTIYNLAPQQEGQLRASLQGMEGVIVRSPDRAPVSGPDTSPSGQAAAAAPFPAIDTSEAIVSRAHLLEQLVSRFPPELEAKLSGSGQTTLREMRARNWTALNRDIDTLVTQLASTRPLSVLDAAPGAGRVESLTQAASSVHRLVTSVYAGGASQVDAASVWPELAAEIARLRDLARRSNAIE